MAEADDHTAGERISIGLGEAASLLGLLGALLYTALRVAYGLFYAQLDTTPEAVGLGYQQILAQSVGALLLVVVAAVVAVAAAAAAGTYLRTQAADWDSVATGPMPREAKWWFIGIGVILAVFYAVFFRGDWGQVAGVGSVVLIAMGIALYIRYRRLDARRARWARVAYVSLFIIVFVALVFVFLSARALDDAEAVRAGDEGRFEVFGVPVTSWGATTGTVESDAAGVPDGCVGYLGQADSVIVVFDHTAKRTLRIPVGESVVSLGGC